MLACQVLVDVARLWPRALLEQFVSFPDEVAGNCGGAAVLCIHCRLGFSLNDLDLLWRKRLETSPCLNGGIA